MPDRRNRKALLVAEQALGWGAELITDALEQSQREINLADGYPTKTPGASEPTASGHVPPPCPCKGFGCDNCAPSTYSPAERAGERRAELAQRRRDYEEAVHAWEMQWHWLMTEGQHLRGERLAHAEGQRCSGQVDATCTNLAAKHRHPDTSAEEILVCDHCWLDACRGCRRRATDGRYIDVDGVPTLACEACYRRQLRAGRAA